MHTRARNRPGLPIAVLLGLCLATWLSPDAVAACDCGGGDGVFSTHTGIVIDGAFADWTSVLADDDNNSCDGGLLPQPGPDLPIDPQPDLDATVQSTGRDLIHFAYTWDNTHIKTYTARVASSSNVQRFVYYADLDNDGLMETGERVIVVSWKGSNRTVDVFLGTYVALGSSGDSMVDLGTGMADGYMLPGTVTGLPAPGNPDYSGSWGSSSGLSMEWGIPWADSPGAPGLGLPAGTAFTFHVSSTNTQPQASSFPGQVDDNMGGCGGGPATTQYAGVLFEPDRTLSGISGSTFCAAHVVTNQGNADDIFDFTSVITGDHTPGISYYQDVDADGTLSAGDTLLADSSGDGNPDSGTLTPAASISILICYTIAAADSGTATIVTTATSDWDSRAEDEVTDTVTVTPEPDLLATKTVAVISDPVNGVSAVAKAIPGAVVEYTITLENQGFGTVDSDATTITDPIPTDSKLFVGDLGGPGSGPVAFTDGSPASGVTFSFAGLSSTTDGLSFSDDNGVSYTYVPAPGIDGFDSGVTHVRMSFGGAMNSAGGGNPNFSVRFRVGVR